MNAEKDNNYNVRDTRRISNAFFLAQGMDMVVGWSLGGAVIAKLIPSAES
jgi:hypothetical protein